MAETEPYNKILILFKMLEWKIKFTADGNTLQHQMCDPITCPKQIKFNQEPPLLTILP